MLHSLINLLFSRHLILRTVLNVVDCHWSEEFLLNEHGWVLLLILRLKGSKKVTAKLLILILIVVLVSIAKARLLNTTTTRDIFQVFILKRWRFRACYLCGVDMQPDLLLGVTASDAILFPEHLYKRLLFHIALLWYLPDFSIYLSFF